MNPNRLNTSSEQSGDRPEISRARKQQMGRTTLGTMTTAQDESLEYNVPSITLQEKYFDDVYDAKTIQADEAYCARRKQGFEDKRIMDGRDEREADSERETLAKIMEKLTLSGIQLGRWLGNVTGAEKLGRRNFETASFYATKTDDISRRVDVFTTLKLEEPIETETGDVYNLPLGFDVTVNGSREAVFDKLTRAYSDDAKLPFGFSHLKYYTNGTDVKGELGMIPRYVIGLDISHDSAEAMQKALRASDPDVFSGSMLRNRFMILSEIRAQNKLYSAMLPEDAYDTDDEQIRRVAAYIDAADAVLGQALTVCATDIVRRMNQKGGIYLSPDLTGALNQATADLGEAARGKYPEIIREHFLREEHESYLERQREQAKRAGMIYDEKDDPNDSTFVMIMKMSEALYERAFSYDPEQQDPALEARRGIAVQNKTLVPTKPL